MSTFLKGKIDAGITKIRFFVERKVVRQQNNLFQNNQRQVYKELGVVPMVTPTRPQQAC